MEDISDLQATGSNSTLRKTVGSWEISWKTNSPDFCLMDSGLDRQVLTICLEMQSWLDCLSTMWVMPDGLLKKEMRSYSLETGVGMMVSREHLVVSRSNSSLVAVGSPEQRSKPEVEPDLLSMKEKAAKRGLITHMRGVFRSAVRSPFMSPQRPTVRDFKTCGATTSILEPLDKTLRPCSGTWEETTPSWKCWTMTRILPSVFFLMSF